MLKEAVETAYLHYNRALSNYEEIKNWTINEELFEDREKVKTTDAFIFRFIKLALAKYLKTLSITSKQKISQNKESKVI